jgi:hypothetical protein
MTTGVAQGPHPIMAILRCPIHLQAIDIHTNIAFHTRNVTK